MSEDRLFLNGYVWDDFQEEIVSPYLYSVRVPGLHPSEYREVDPEILIVNDFCFFTTTTALERINNLESRLESLKSGQSKAVVEDLGEASVGAFEEDGKEYRGPIDTSHEAIEWIETHELPFWKNQAAFLSRAVSLIMVAFLLEKRLVDVAEELTGKRVMASGGLSKIDTAIKIIENASGAEIIQSQAVIELKQKIKSVRNMFAHGEWEKAEEEMKSMNLPQAFRVVGEILSQIRVPEKARRWEQK